MKPGDKIGRYHLGQQIGEGAVARVFASRHPVLERDVAIKVLKQEAFHDAHYVARFLDDARSAHRLDHPNIVRVLDVDEAEGRSFIVMELVDGQPLDHWLVGRRIEALEAARIARDIARALAAAHAGGLVHRDVKPSNVLVDNRTGLAKLTDFGAAKRDRPDGVQLTEIGQRIGTPRYMAPEQVEGSQVDARTDLFALGATLYELLAGRPAFDANTVSAAFHAILFSTPPSLTELRPDAPAELVQLVERLLAKAPEARPSSAEEVVAELDAVLGASADAPTASTLTSPVVARTASGPVAATVTTPATATAHGGETSNKRLGGNMLNNRLVPAAAAAVLVVVLGIGVWWWLSPAPEPELALETDPATAGAAPVEETAAPEPETATAPPPEDVAEEPVATAETAPETQEAAPEEELDPVARARWEAEQAEIAATEQAAAEEELDPVARARWEAEQAETAATEQAAAEEELDPVARARWELEQAELAAAEEAGPEEELDPVARARWELEQAEQATPADEPQDVAAVTPGVATPPPAARETVECAAPESEAPGCALAAQAVRTLDEPSGVAPELTLNREDGIYLDQDYLVIEAALPDDLGGYLYVDVLTDAGSVYHLLPEPMRENNQLPPGGVIRIGVEEVERSEGVRHWQVGEPFGKAYLIAVLSESPLYEGVRPIAEPVASYKDVLLGALSDGSGEKRVSIQPIEFQPR